MNDKEIIFELVQALQSMLELAANQGLSENHGAIIDAKDALDKALGKK